MDMTGQYRIPAKREQVWAALNDPEVLRQAIPGCESVERLSDTELTAVATARIGPVQARFKGKITMADLDPPRAFTLQGEGAGGAAGFAKGNAKVRLEEDGGGTLLSYEVQATVGGKIAQMGQRLIDSTAKKMSDEFFDAFAKLAGGAAAHAVATPGGDDAATTPPSRARLIWGGVLLAVAVLLIALSL